MESIIRYDSKPELIRPLVIEGLPGIGNVGKIAADYLANALGAKRFACLYSPDFPPQISVDSNCVADFARNELWFAKAGDRDIVFISGSYQGSTPEGQFLICSDIMEALLSYDPSEIITLGGYGTGTMVESPRVLGAVSRMDVRPAYEDLGVVFEPGEPKGGIVGASAMFLAFGQIYGIDSICLMGETPGYFIDHKSAGAVMAILVKKLGVEVDTRELDTHSAMIDELNQKVKELENSRNSCEDLNYFG
ncbi:MAG: proteasome assembly chaperone family protein [Methanomassiliicoccaceae archaeon]|nr:proteasome assembly chaperone family protein [Methanomassiliicoccaceae archaeon]